MEAKNKPSDIKAAYCKHCGEKASVQLRKIGGEPYYVNVFDRHKRGCLTLRVQKKLGFKGD